MRGCLRGSSFQAKAPAAQSDFEARPCVTCDEMLTGCAAWPPVRVDQQVGSRNVLPGVELEVLVPARVRAILRDEQAPGELPRGRTTGHRSEERRVGKECRS